MRTSRRCGEKAAPEARPGVLVSAATGSGDGDLVAREPRWGRTTRTVLVGTVQYGEPLCDRTAGPGGLFGIRIRLGFEFMTTPWCGTALFLRLAFDGLGVRVVDTETEGAAAVSGLGSNAVGWYFGDPRGSVPTEVTLSVAVDVPDEVETLTGTLRVEMPIARTGRFAWRTAHARTSRVRELAITVPGRGIAAGTRIETDRVLRPTASFPSSPAVRLCVAADIERYSRFRAPQAVRAQERLVGVLARAQADAGIGDADVETHPSGDGQFIVFPPGLDESRVIPALIHGFRAALAELNHDLSEHARLRLRIALHRGHMRLGPNGWAGDSTIAVHRILDSAHARQALVDHPAADLAVIVPDLLYRDVIAHGYGLLRPESFAMTDVEVPAKGFAERVWIHVPEKW